MKVQPAFPGVEFVSQRAQYVIVGEGAEGTKSLTRYTEAQRVQQARVWEALGEQ